MQVSLQNYIPDEIKKTLIELEKEIGDLKFSKKNAEKTAVVNQLKQYTKLNVFGFNSGKTSSFFFLYNYIIKLGMI